MMQVEHFMLNLPFTHKERPNDGAYKLVKPSRVIENISIVYFLRIEGNKECHFLLHLCTVGYKITLFDLPRFLS